MLFSPALARAGTVLAATIAVVAVPAVASAHVTLSPDTAEPGSYGTFVVRVPNEMDDASTVKVQVFLPADHPIASVSTQPVPGWTVSVKQQKVTWSGGRIEPGEFQQFPLSLGPLPEDADALYFKSLQTYSNGEVVRWIELPDGAQEPAHPAPTVTLSAPVETAAPATTTTADGSGSGTTLGVIALVVSVCGLAVAGWAVRRAGGRAAP